MHPAAQVPERVPVAFQGTACFGVTPLIQKFMSTKNVQSEALGVK
jgi:hypothetical protein